MAEVRQHAAAAKVLRKGITDMVRISDARMSGTAYGTDDVACGARGCGWRPSGAGAQWRHGRVNVPERRLQLLVSDEEWPADWRSGLRPHRHWTQAIGSCTLTM
jgi:dihydroxy-acid dehydratase